MKPFADGYGFYAAAGWPGIVPCNAKAPAVTGFTGAKNAGINADAQQLAEWSAGALGQLNIGLRLPTWIIAIDVDSAEGDDLLRRAEERLGSLPATWSSTSRGAGQPRRIYLYRMPGVAGLLPGSATTPEERLRTEFAGVGVDVVHHGYRTVVVQPSVHPDTGQRYRWYEPNGQVAMWPPRPEQLEVLPEAWIAFFTAPVPEPVRRTRLDGVESASTSSLERRWHDLARALRECPHGGYAAAGALSWLPGGENLVGLNGEALCARVGYWVGQYGGDVERAVEILWEEGAGHWDYIGQNGPREIEAKLRSAAEKGEQNPRPWEEPLARPEYIPIPEGAIPGGVGGDVPTVYTAPGEGPVWGRPRTDVSNVAQATLWLTEAIGQTGPLAGMFRRRGEVVYTPRVTQGGYVQPKREGDSDGPAQVRAVDAGFLAACVFYGFDCFKVRSKETKPGERAEGDSAKEIEADSRERSETDVHFPMSAAATVLHAEYLLPNLRTLRGVVHIPVVRRDGSMLWTPGYDPETQLLFIPQAGLAVPPIPEDPTGAEMGIARGWIDYMLAQVPFVSEDHYANYVGALLTPLLREVVPPPWKMLAIDSHNPGSGKTLLAQVAAAIHGGVLRTELPSESEEIRKSITGVLYTTTGPVVIFDNVEGTVRSSLLAGLLTSREWSDRILGSNRYQTMDNDRLWAITGNNIHPGGDMARRLLWVRIDAGIPNPENRTGFAIGDLESWARDNRSMLLWSLLTFVARWVADGMPREAASGYKAWSDVVGRILAGAGYTGRFDSLDSRGRAVATDDDEWGQFLAAIRSVFGSNAWTAREVLERVEALGTLPIPGVARIPYEAIPGGLVNKLKGRDVVSLSKSLGHWLANRSGRWAQGLTIRAGGKSDAGIMRWQVVAAADE